MLLASDIRFTHHFDVRSDTFFTRFTTGLTWLSLTMELLALSLLDIVAVGIGGRLIASDGCLSA